MLSYETLIEKRRRMLIGIVLAVCAVMIVATATAPKAKAGTSWTGCGAGVHGAMIEGALAVPPISVGATGQSAGVSVFCDYQMAAMVAGAFVETDRIWGNVHTLGADYNVGVGARIGVLPWQPALIYGFGQWTRTYLSGVGSNEIDGWGLGAGIEVKIKSTPMSADLRYRHDWVDDKPVFPGADIRGDSIRFGINVKFGPNLIPVLYDDTPEPAAACDPKLANCKKIKP